jgi:hypothetical protein
MDSYKNLGTLKCKSHELSIGSTDIVESENIEMHNRLRTDEFSIKIIKNQLEFDRI